MARVEGVFFDIDGTVVNTWEFVVGGFEYAIKSAGYPVPSREHIKTHIANPLRVCYELLFPDGDIDHLASAHGEFQVNNPHLVVPFSDTLTVLSEIRENGLLIAAITSRNTQGCLRILEALGIRDYFDLVIGADDVKKHKPDPEGVNKALQHFNLNSQSAIMVGDTHPDIHAGRAAGVRTVGVTYGFDGPNIVNSNPDFVIDNLSELITIISEK